MKSVYPALMLAGGLAVLAVNTASAEEFEVDGKVFGLPEAEVFEEDYDGPPAVGELLSHAPGIVPLDYEGNRTHEVRMDAVVQEIDVADGQRFRAWTFGGTVPGPVLHVREGDRVEFTMKNRSNEKVVVTEPGASPYHDALSRDAGMNPEPGVAPMPHSMDFHSGTVAADDKWRTIPPGKSIRFDWVANYPGVYMYHCSTPSVLMHASMGQYGVVVVEPEEGYPDEADRSYVLVQSEFYLGDDRDGIRPYDHARAMAKEPTIMAFNGHRNRHVSNPLQARAGERVRLYLLNAGPNMISSFHIIGAILDKVYPEGNLENVQHGMQTTVLGASNGSVIDFIVPEAGKYKFVDHSFAHAERGALGVIEAAPRE